MKELTEAEALNKAAAYCTLCERCRYEVTAKLTAWGVAHTAQERILQRLEKEGFVNENRYCRAFVNDKVRFNRWGRMKIIAAMREKRLQQNDITDAIAQIDEEQYMEALRSVVDGKRKELKNNDDYTSRQKIMRFAASRGFEPQLIMNVIGGSYDLE